jgi:hypothetical protein
MGTTRIIAASIVGDWRVTSSQAAPYVASGEDGANTPPGLCGVIRRRAVTGTARGMVQHIRWLLDVGGEAAATRRLPGR